VVVDDPYGEGQDRWASTEEEARQDWEKIEAELGAGKDVPSLHRLRHADGAIVVERYMVHRPSTYRPTDRGVGGR